MRSANKIPLPPVPAEKQPVVVPLVDADSLAFLHLLGDILFTKVFTNEKTGSGLRADQHERPE